MNIFNKIGNKIFPDYQPSGDEIKLTNILKAMLENQDSLIIKEAYDSFCIHNEKVGVDIRLDGSTFLVVNGDKIIEYRGTSQYAEYLDSLIDKRIAEDVHKFDDVVAERKSRVISEIENVCIPQMEPATV